MTVGQHVRAARLARKETLQACSDRLNVGLNYLSDVEHGRRKISYATAARWARVLGASQVDFVGAALQADLDANGIGLKVRVE